MDTTQYRRILDEVLVPVVNISPVPLNFVHDRYPVHHARAVVEWFERQGEMINVLPWPGSMGDIMPLERVWTDVIGRIRRRAVLITSHDQLWSEIQIVWEGMFDADYVLSLVQHIPEQLNNVVRNNGGWV